MSTERSYITCVTGNPQSTGPNDTTLYSFTDVGGYIISIKQLPMAAPVLIQCYWSTC